MPCPLCWMYNGKYLALKSSTNVKHNKQWNFVAGEGQSHRYYRYSNLLVRGIVWEAVILQLVFCKCKRVENQVNKLNPGQHLFEWKIFHYLYAQMDTKNNRFAISNYLWCSINTMYPNELWVSLPYVLTITMLQNQAISSEIESEFDATLILVSLVYSLSGIDWYPIGHHIHFNILVGNLLKASKP